VVYRDRNTYRPARILHVDPLSKSYLIEFEVNGKIKQRETPQDRVSSNPTNVNLYFKQIEAEFKAIRERLDRLARVLER